MLLRDYVTKHVCVCAVARSFPHTHTGDLSQPGARRRAGRFGETGPPPSPCPPSQGTAGSRTSTRAPTTPHCREGLTLQPWGPGGVPPPRWCGVTPLGQGTQGGHHWDTGKGEAQPCSLFWGVAAVAPLFAPESPNIGVLRLRLSCRGSVAFPVPIAMLPGARAPAELATAAGRLPLLRGER